MASKHPLRRSCAFCRARKIKCSNETICEACRRQGADCIYDFESPRPKSPKTLKIQKTSLSSNVTEELPVPLEGFESVAMALDQTFYENFSQKMAGMQDYGGACHQVEKTGAKSTPKPKNIRYMGILSLLSQDLVGFVTHRFGSLGSRHVEEGAVRFFISGLADDESLTMFDSPPPSSSPLSNYDPRQRTQLIEVWYSVHPLSFLVSKTLLLRELCDGTHDEILLATMLADANFSIGDEVTIARGDVLLRWAIAQLRNRPLQASQHSSTGGSIASGVLRRVFSGISTAQALMLLAWNALSSRQLRRALCYIILAGRMASEIKDQMANAASQVASSRINGIGVFDVEKEIVAFLYWATYSLTLWASIQMGNGPFPETMPASLLSIFLPATETSSVMIQLDLISENFSTLQKQKSVMKEMRPVAHIASVVAYIFTTCPQGWKPMPSEDIAATYQEVGRMLTESIHAQTRQTSEVSSRGLLLVVYYAIAIHLLFPAGLQHEESISPELMDRFCTSTEEALQLFSTTPHETQDAFGVVSSLLSSLPGLFCLFLDSCARALDLLRGKTNSISQAYENRLELLTRYLYEMSQDDFLNPGPSIRPIRKHLKACVRAYGFSSTISNSSGISSQESLGTSPKTLAACEPEAFPVAPGLVVESPSPYGYMPDSASSSSEASTATSFSPFEANKPDWHQFHGAFPEILDATGMGVPSEDPLSMAELADMHGTWSAPTPTIIDVDMIGHLSVQCGQWEWSDTTAEATTPGSAMYPGFYSLD